jgi:dTDP-4-dehydrorhamnose reductase
MKVLVLGGAGMLGHRLYATLRARHETVVTVRRPASDYDPLGFFDPRDILDRVDALVDADLKRSLDTARPDAVVNCVGVIKQLREAEDPITAISVNALLPHRLARLCAEASVRLVHVSTDCVFSGRKGRYTEDDTPDPIDRYGRSKLLGEVDAPGAVTLRTSMIGREIRTRSGLVEWFISHRGGSVRGFERALYTGFTTATLSRIIAEVLETHADLTGVWHVSSEPIDKFSLLRMINDRMGLGIRVDPDHEFACDRSLDSTRYRARTGFRPPSWAAMIDEMCADTTPYDRWRSAR